MMITMSGVTKPHIPRPIGCLSPLMHVWAMSLGRLSPLIRVCVVSLGRLSSLIHVCVVSLCRESGSPFITHPCLGRVSGTPFITHPCLCRESGSPFITHPCPYRWLVQFRLMSLHQGAIEHPYVHFPYLTIFMAITCTVFMRFIINDRPSSLQF